MKKSFTLLEILVAISIIGIGILKVISLISSQIFSLSHTQNRLIASFLAQEAVEIVRNIRDTNWIKDQSWDIGINLNNGTTTKLDYKSSSIPDNSILFCEKLKFDGSFYNCTNGKDTPFKREIFIQKNPTEMTIRVRISWQEKGREYQYFLSEKIFNWR